MPTHPKDFADCVPGPHQQKHDQGNNLNSCTTAETPWLDRFCIGEIDLYLLENGTIEWFGPGDGNIYLTPDELERYGQGMINFAKSAKGC